MLLYGGGGGGGWVQAGVFMAYIYVITQASQNLHASACLPSCKFKRDRKNRINCQASGKCFVGFSLTLKLQTKTLNCKSNIMARTFKKCICILFGSGSRKKQSCIMGIMRT